MRYEVLYDVRDLGASFYGPLVLGAVFCAVMGGILYRLPMWRGVRYLALTLPLVVVPTVVVLNVAERGELIEAVSSGTALEAVGKIVDFRPTRGAATFHVGKARLCYTAGPLAGELNFSRVPGGPIREGLDVRVWHVGCKIARLVAVRPAPQLSPR